MVYRPEFDYDPQSDEAVQAALQAEAAPDLASLPSVYDVPDYGPATVPTLDDYTGDADAQMWQTAMEAQTDVDESRDIQAAVAEYDAQQEAEARAALAQGRTPQGMANQHQANADAYTSALLDQRRVPSSPNPVHPIRQAHAQQTADIANAQVQARATTAAAQVGMYDAEAQAYEAEAGRQRAMIDAQQAMIAREQQRRDDAIEGERFLFKQIQDATDKLASTPDQDRGRFWASQTGFQKFGWALRAIGDGMRGLDPLGALNQAIEGDINDQRALYEARSHNVQKLSGQLQDFRSLYADLRSSGLDDLNASDAMRVARIEQSKALLMAEQLRNGIPLAMAQQHEGILELEQAKTDLLAGLSERLAKTPMRIGGGTVPTLRGPIRGTVEKLRAESAKDAQALRMEGVQQSGAAAQQERGAQLDVEKERAKREGAPQEASQRRIDVDQKKWIVEHTEPFRNEERLLSSFLDDYKDEVPGLVWGLGWQKKLQSDAAKLARKRAMRIVMVRLRRESGAAIPVEELEKDAENELDAFGESDLRALFSERLREVRDRIDYIERGVEEGAVEGVNRAQSAPRAPIAAGGAGIDDEFIDDGE